MDSKTIWNEKQNKPSLIVEDIEALSYNNLSPLTRDNVYETLLRRGAFKAFFVRREAITLKHGMKKKVASLQLEIARYRAMRPEAFLKGKSPRRSYFRGRKEEIDKRRGALKMLEDIVRRLDAILKCQRWIAPDNDRVALKWLSDRVGIQSPSQSSPHGPPAEGVEICGSGKPLSIQF